MTSLKSEPLIQALPVPESSYVPVPVKGLIEQGVQLVTCQIDLIYVLFFYAT